MVVYWISFLKLSEKFYYNSYIIHTAVALIWPVLWCFCFLICLTFSQILSFLLFLLLHRNFIFIVCNVLASFFVHIHVPATYVKVGKYMSFGGMRTMALSCAVTMVMGEGVAFDFWSTLFVRLLFWVQYNYQWPVYNYHCDRFVCSLWPWCKVRAKT